MIIIPKKIYDKMVEHAISELPNEACGILAGKQNIVSEIYTMENIDKSPDSFFMKPAEQLMVIRDLRRKKIDMISIYHSHPNSPARPSKKDIEMAFYEDVNYIIISLQNKIPVIKAFKIINNEFSETPIKLI